MTNPRKHVVRTQPVGAGRMSAQSPGAGAVERKATVLAGSLEQNKEERNRPAKRISFGDSPYTVLSTDEFLLVNVGGGQVDIILPLTSGSHRQRLTICRVGLSANHAHLTPNDTVNEIIQTQAFGGLHVYLKEHAGGAGISSVTLIAPDISNYKAWHTIAQLGTIDPTP